jgi:hypothetical protein
MYIGGTHECGPACWLCHECFEAAALVHATKLKSRFLTLENKSKACQMFVAIEIKGDGKFYV